MMLLLLLIDISEPRNMSNKSSETETETVPVTVTYNNDVNTLTATVKIEDFKKKMKTWPSDKFIMSHVGVIYRWFSDWCCSIELEYLSKW